MAKTSNFPAIESINRVKVKQLVIIYDVPRKITLVSSASIFTCQLRETGTIRTMASRLNEAQI
ncbi:hypothetical protein [Thalassospira australica]|uniref:hypothetical protein n=1 Tax=Thalassospira australica TaxID=1528106 RepID=UPI000ADC50E1|nr:hypothetical protein [Thalassospira australica]